MAKRIELTKYSKRSDFRSSLSVVGHLALVVSPLALAAFVGPRWWWIVMWIAFGFLMNGLLNPPTWSTARRAKFCSKPISR